MVALREGGSKGDTQIWVDSYNMCIRNLTFSYIQWKSISKWEIKGPFLVLGSEKPAV